MISTIFLFHLIIVAGRKEYYKMVVGRSDKVEGPYKDQEGVPMNMGGGSTC
jgi:arabinan endo-1,5-alpha-L-arabinosidase